MRVIKLARVASLTEGALYFKTCLEWVINPEEPGSQPEILFSSPVQAQSLPLLISNAHNGLPA
eukprot:1151401-Pelagomonas_calceolata.AAC.1